MYSKTSLIVGCVVASHGFGQSIHVRPIGVSALANEGASTVMLECAFSGDSVFGGHVMIEAASGDVGFATATGVGPFESVHEASEGSVYRIEASQRLGRLDTTLGFNSEPVDFATIELEILTNRPFESGIWVSGTVTEIGGQPTPATMEFVGEQPEGGGVITSSDGKRLFIPIRCAAPDPVPSSEIPLAQWTTESDPLTLSIQPAGGGAAVTTLTAGSEYELHYDAGENEVDSYVLFFAGEDASHSISELARAGSGDWADTGYFSGDLAAPNASAEGGLPGGFQRNAQVFDMHAPGAERAASTGHLLNFTPQSAGSLGVELYMQMLDPENGRSVEMQKSMVLDVQSGE